MIDKNKGLLKNFWLIVVLKVATGNLVQESCHPNHFKKLITHHEAFIIYGVTQDCQIFFARADQLHLINTLRVQSRVTYCLPELVQLHWRELHTSDSIGLELIFKRPNHQICVVPLEFPAKHVLHGNHLFSYSISGSMNYARCSYITNSSFVMEPDLSFMDSTFGDVIYFVDPQSTGSFWTIRQFKLDKDGLRHSLETFIVKNYAESHKHRLHPHRANEYLLNLDAQRRKLHAVHRQSKHDASVCAYDLLFKPHKAHIREHVLEISHNLAHKFRINSFSADGNLSIFGEFHQASRDQFDTKIKMADLGHNNSHVCLFQLPFLLEIGLIREKSLEDLKTYKLPPFSRHLIPQKQVEHDKQSTQKSHQHSFSPQSHHTHKPPVHGTHHHSKTITLPTIKATVSVTTSEPQKSFDKASLLEPTKKLEDDEEIEESEQSSELGFLTDITTKESGKEDQKHKHVVEEGEASGETSGENPVDEAGAVLENGAEQNSTTDSLNAFFVLFACADSLLIYRRKPKPKLICREDHEWTISGGETIGTSGLSAIATLESSRKRRDTEDAIPEPVIFLNSTKETHSDGYEFEIVSDDLTDDEKNLLRKKLIRTCISLDILPKDD